MGEINHIHASPFPPKPVAEAFDLERVKRTLGFEPDPALKKMLPKVSITVHIDDGNVFEYDVAGPDQAREHLARIASIGYRHTYPYQVDHYPPHRVLKVIAKGPGVGSAHVDGKI